MTSSQLFDEYDIIIAGGGAAGGVVLGRLVAANPSLRILMLEAGPTTKNDLAHIQPARFLAHLLPGSNTVKHVVGKPSDYLDGRQLTVPCGQCIGGGSSVGWMVYTRPPVSDYDDWANAETYQVAPGQPSHGYDGPIKVSYGVHTSVGDDHIAAVLEYDKAHAMADDGSSVTLMDMDSFERWPKWIDAETGRRTDVAHAYIYPALEASPNVHLLSGCIVRKVIKEDEKATGVEYVVNSKVTPHADGTARTARAAKLVVLSAGTFGSPGILERSGIGERGVLERNGIEQVVELPGVGENFSDHALVILPFHAKEDADTLHGIAHGDRSEHENAGLDSAMWYQPTEQEARKIGPEFAERWASFYAGAPDKPVAMVAQLSGYHGASPPSANDKVYCTGGNCTYPLGTASVHITSAHDVDSPADFETGVLSRKEDLSITRYVWKLCREHSRRMSSYRGEYAPDFPKFPAGSAAAVSPDHNTPVPADAPDIVYTEEDDRVIDDFLKANVITPWDSLGTCAMKSRDKDGVVDSRLNVYGVQNLKVADMSVCPSIIAANTCSTAVVVGEKAALIIGEEMGFATRSV